MKVTTANYLKKRIVSLLFNEKMYHKIKLYKIILDFKLGKNYEDIKVMLSKLVSQDAIILDIGANMGQYACRLSKYLKNGHVYSFEPFTQNYDALLDMKRVLHLENCSTFRLAVSDKTEVLKLKIPIFKKKLVIGTQAVLESYERVTFDDVEYRIEDVNSITIDKFISDKMLQRLDMIKIDTEGAEIAVMKGAINSLFKYKPILLVEINPCDTRLNFLYDIGYKAYTFNKNMILKYDKELHQHHGNAVFIHREFINNLAVTK